MKNSLIIRSASMETMDKLIKYLKENNKNDNIYCLIQKSSIKDFKEKYSHINYIDKEDGFFKYKNYKHNLNLKTKLRSINFDNIYIPSSYINFPGFEDTFMIASKINSKKYILFNVDGEVQEQKLNFVSLWIDKYIGYLIYFIKVLIALIGIFIIYIFAYPYYFIKKLFVKIKEFLRCF